MIFPKSDKCFTAEPCRCVSRGVNVELRLGDGRYPALVFELTRSRLTGVANARLHRMHSLRKQIRCFSPAAPSTAAAVAAASSAFFCSSIDARRLAFAALSPSVFVVGGLWVLLLHNCPKCGWVASTCLMIYHFLDVVAKCRI